MNEILTENAVFALKQTKLEALTLELSEARVAHEREQMDVDADDV